MRKEENVGDNVGENNLEREITGEKEVGWQEELCTEEGRQLRVS